MENGQRKRAFSGLGESGAFYRSHPLLNCIYFAGVIGITMFSSHPAFLVASFVLAWTYSVLLRGEKAWQFNCLILLPTMLLTVLLNTLNVHNGITVLFYFNDNPITKEAVVYGFAMALMLSSVIIWFSCFGAVVTEDKLLYLFGRTVPTIALTLSMTLRLIPLLRNRFREVSAAQRCMGRGGRSAGFISRIRQFGKEVSILIAWSLEASVESADSMEARGYGLRGRTSFHLFRLTGAERWLLPVMLFLCIAGILGCAFGHTAIYYYPVIILPPVSLAQGLSFAAFCALMLSAIVIDIKGVRKWN